jgi:two-component system, cell cycle response regulator
LTSPSSSPIDLRDLRLDDARALLEHSGAIDLPPPDVAPMAYLQGVIDGLCELSLTDPLTGLANRRHFRAALVREIEVVVRSGNPALLLMLDIDHFKAINDAHGHLAGDRVLQAVARCLAACVRPQDTVARYGGEEFAIVLPDCQLNYGEAVAERIRQAVAGLSIEVSPELKLQITISVGGAFAPVRSRCTPDLWIERADNQLYQAKAQGRNRVYIDHQQVISVSAEEKSLLFGQLSMGEPEWSENVPGTTADSAMQKVNP